MPITAGQERLYCFWDYNLTEEDLRAILAGDDEQQKAWAMARVLEAARWDDIWKYVSLRDVREWFPRLPLRPDTRRVWAHALKVWEEAASGE